MARNLRYGPRFSNSSNVGTRGRDVLKAAHDLRQIHAPGWIVVPRLPVSMKSKIASAQNTSATRRKKKGLAMPSVAAFSFNADITPRQRAMLTAAAVLRGGRAVGIALEQGGSALVTVAQGRKHRYVWVNIETGKVEGIEP